MKYEYEGTSKKEIIKNYEKKEDKIIINFLDGYNCEVPLTEENESDLLKIMLDQAQDRNNITKIKELEKHKKTALIGAILTTVSTFVNGSAYFLNNSNNEEKIVNLIIGILSGVCAIYGIAGYKAINDEIKDLKKYELYLSMKEYIENSNAQEYLFDGIKNNELNINILDSYTLKEMYQLRKNLEIYESCKPYFSNNPKSITLTKKN